MERGTNRIATDTGFLMFLQKCSKMGNQDFYDDHRTAAVAVAGTKFEAENVNLNNELHLEGGE